MSKVKTGPEDYLKAMKAKSQEILASKELAISFLVKTGINTKSGKLTKIYREGSQAVKSK